MYVARRKLPVHIFGTFVRDHDEVAFAGYQMLWCEERGAGDSAKHVKLDSLREENK